MRKGTWSGVFVLVGVFAGQALAIDNDLATSRESRYLIGVHHWHPLQNAPLDDPAAFNKTDPTQFWEPVSGDPMRSTYGRLVDRGWLVHSANAYEYSGVPARVIKRAYEQGMTNILRINYRSYPRDGKWVHETVPLTNREDDLNEFCAQIRNMLTQPVWTPSGEYLISDYAHIYIIGNEMNLWGECGGYDTGDESNDAAKITPQWYATVFKRVADAIHNVQSNARVLVAPPANWSYISQTDPGEGAAFNWDTYWDQELAALYADPAARALVGGLAIHTYGYHDCVHLNPRQDDEFSGFRCYRWMIQTADGQGFGTVPIYITETNTVNPDAPGNPCPHHYTDTEDWYLYALAEVADWNESHGRRIKCLVWFQWYDNTQSFDWCQMLWPDGRDPINEMDKAQSDYKYAIWYLNYHYPGAADLKNTAATMTGRVWSVTGSPLPHAIVWTDKGNYRCVSDSSGYYVLSLTGGRTYNVYVDYGGRSFHAGMHTVSTLKSQDLSVSTTTYGVVQGNLLDGYGLPIESGRITTVGTYAAASDRVQPNGSHHVCGSGSDTVRVWASLPGYQTREITGVSITPGSTTNLNVALGTASNYCPNGGLEQGHLADWTTFGSGIDGVRTGPWYDDIGPVGGTFFLGAAINCPYESGYANLSKICGVKQHLPLSWLPTGTQMIASCMVITRRHNSVGTLDGLAGDAAVRIGIHPTGSLDENSTGIVWSDWYESDSVWTPLYTPVVTLSGTAASIFVHFRLHNQSYSVNNDVYAQPCAEWKIAAVDDIYLTPITSPTVQGTVRSGGSPVNQVQATLSSYNGQYVCSLPTSASGLYTCNGVVPNPYRLTFSHPAYYPLELDLGYLGNGEVRQNINADLTPRPTLTLSNIQNSTPSQTSTTITWNTSVASDTVVEYGTTTAYGSVKVVSNRVTSHSVALSGLSPGTTYHYRVSSVREGFVPGVSDDQTFTTLLPMTISNIYVDNIAQTSARVRWTTNVASTSRVYYRVSGTTTWSSVYNASLVSSHVMTVSGLLASTTYQYYVKSTRSGYQDATSSIRTFTTAAGGSTGTLTGTVTYNDLYGGWMQPGRGEDLTQDRTDKPLKRIGAGATADGHDRYSVRVVPPPDDGIPETGPLPGATVTVAGLSAVSNLNGSYTITGIPAGTYTATCHHPDRGTLSGTVTITANGTTYKNWQYNGYVW